MHHAEDDGLPTILSLTICSISAKSADAPSKAFSDKLEACKITNIFI